MALCVFCIFDLDNQSNKSGLLTEFGPYATIRGTHFSDIKFPSIIHIFLENSKQYEYEY